MNIDFHYYGTYVAARLAGYDFNEAQLIAHSAQYVDDSSKEKLQDSLGYYYIQDFFPVPTVQTLNDMEKKDIHWSEGGMREIFNIWVPFHFLPGNYGDNTSKKDYTGPMEDRGTMYSWKFDEMSKKQFELMCLPDSLLVKSMVNDVINEHSDKTYTLFITGLRMHVLADTWAHMFYIGIPAWFTNNANDPIYRIDGDSKTEIKWQRIWPWADSINFITGGEFATPDMMAYNSLVYLGHGRTGHLPDYPYLKYQYRPEWSNTDIVKDNTSYFLNAFKQMVYALKCINNKEAFITQVYANLPQDTETTITTILSTNANDQSSTWRAKIPSIKINGISLEVPEEYDENKWLNEMNNASDIKTTNYYYFNQSASFHLQHVQTILEENNIYTYFSPKKNIAATKFKSAKGNYVGTMYKGAGRWGQYYPKMSDTAIQLQIVKVTGAPLKDGDIVEIKTTEAATGQYRYLGAWSTDKYLYYYARAYSETKQKWLVKKVDLSVSNLINDGDRVKFLNIYFNDEPYMATCDYSSIFGGSGTYLTTQSNGNKDEAIWIMDGFSQFDVNVITPDYFVSFIIDLPTSTSIHNDILVYGIIDENDRVDINNLQTALDNIGIAFISTPLTSAQQRQVTIMLYDIVEPDN